MLIQQISVFIENKKGRLAEITSLLKEAGIDIHAISIADTTNFGILRMIVNDPDVAFNVIHKAGYTVKKTNVLAVEANDRPGGLNDVLNILDNHDISVEYLYSFVKNPAENAYILLKVSNTDKAIELFKDSNITILTQAFVNNL